MKARNRRILMWLILPGTLAGVMIALPLILPDDFQISVVFLFPTLIIAAFGLHHGFTLDPRYLDKWAKAHGIPLTPGIEPIVRRYLLRGRRIRAVGAVAGYVAFGFVEFYREGREMPFGWVTATFAGYLLGAAAAEVWAMRPERGSVRKASLAPRDITDYIPRWAVAGVRIFSVATVLGAASWAIIPEVPQRLRGPDQAVDLFSIIVWSSGAVALALFVEATARRVVRRPQPVSSEELVTLDDAIRSTALHGMYGAGLALILGAFSRTFSELGDVLQFGSGLRNTFFVLALVSGISAVFVWLRLGIDQPWVVRRRRPASAVVA